MKTCKTCKHWDIVCPTMGKCMVNSMRTLGLGGSIHVSPSDTDLDLDVRVLSGKPSSFERKLSKQMITDENFGCVNHKEKQEVKE
jgi:hypothetical protein